MDLEGIYFYGLKGVRPNYKKGWKWLDLSLNGKTTGVYAIASSAYAFGLGVKVDLQKACDLLRSGVECGDGSAMLQLALHHSLGWGVELDHEASVRLLRKSKKASPNQGTTHRALAYAYHHGLGIHRDSTLSEKHYTLAIQHGFRWETRLWINTFHAFGRQDFIEYFEFACAHGCSWGYLGLGYCYAQGKGKSVDFNIAHDYYQKATEKSNPIAHHNLGWFYLLGKHIHPPDIFKALYHFGEAARLLTHDPNSLWSSAIDLIESGSPIVDFSHLDLQPSSIVPLIPFFHLFFPDTHTFDLRGNPKLSPFSIQCVKFLF